ncbi:MAG: DUF692 domain-containing protein [Aestuariivirga sp.]|jgi:hypothetical protein
MSTPAPDIPARGGVGLKAEHYKSVLAESPDLGFFEIHAENYMGAGGPPHRYLSAIRDLYPLSLHGVGLSIGGPGRLDADHLMRLKALIDRYQPGLFSEHLAWSTHETGYLSDLLPLPYTAATLQTVCDHIDETQSVLGRQMLLENPSSYLRFAESSFDEAGFIAEVVRRTGCGLLLDVNNVFVSARNLATGAMDYLAAYPLSHVQEIHLAGHDVIVENGGAVLIDSHAAPVVDDVWQLYAAVIGKTGPLPTLIERDANVPPLAELVAEAGQAERIMRSSSRAAA